jgi:hypothetical protein
MGSGSKNDINQSKVPTSSVSPHLNLIFSIAFAVFVLGPPFLGYQFAPYPLLHVADVFDIFTPLVLLPLYWLMFRGSGDNASLKENLVFMVFAGFWVLGQGMHLSANSINNLLKPEGLTSGDIFNLVYFYDETLSHYLWHFGIIGLSALLIYKDWHEPTAIQKTRAGGNTIAGIIYGFVFFAMVVEGATVPMGLTFSALAIIFITLWSRTKLNRLSLTQMFLVGYSLALVLFIIWGVWHQGFPGFFDSGIV